jgi:DNA-binding NarL/FixJ family response regulator
MKPAPAKKPRIRIAVLESDPLRFVGFRALFDSESDLEILASSIPEVSSLGVVEVVLLGSRNGVNLFDTMAGLKAARPDLKIIVTGSGGDDETILKALAAGAMGYVDEAAAPLEFVQAIRMVSQGISMGAAPRAVHLHRARHYLAEADLPRRSRHLHRSRRRECWSCWSPAARTRRSVRCWASRSAL